jgi:hypothetical protein
MKNESIHRISVEEMLSASKSLVIAYTHFVAHAPKLLRQSMMLAYQTAVDDMLKAMDQARVDDPVIHSNDKKVVLLDSNGHAT